MRRMDHHRYVELLHQLPERARLVVVGIMALVTGMNENPLEPELADRTLGLLDEGWPAAGQNRGECVERAFMLVLNLGGIVAPLLHRGELLMRGFAAHVMRRIRDHADVDAVFVVGVE